MRGTVNLAKDEPFRKNSRLTKTGMAFLPIRRPRWTGTVRIGERQSGCRKILRPARPERVESMFEAAGTVRRGRCSERRQQAGGGRQRGKRATAAWPGRQTTSDEESGRRGRAAEDAQRRQRVILSFDEGSKRATSEAEAQGG